MWKKEKTANKTKKEKTHLFKTDEQKPLCCTMVEHLKTRGEQRVTGKEAELREWSCGGLEVKPGELRIFNSTTVTSYSIESLSTFTLLNNL